MTSPIQPDKTYGVLHTESFFSFLGFAKKVGSDEAQKIDIYLDDKLIDTIEADKFIQKIDDMYDVESKAFTYNLPIQYIGKKAIISFKNHDSGEELLNSPYTLIDKNHEKFNEAMFLHSLEGNFDNEKIQNINTKDSIGFLATEDNILNKDLIKLINIFLEQNLDTRFKLFYFNNEQKKLISEQFNKYLSKIDFIMPKDIYDIANNTSIYIHSSTANEKPKSFGYHKLWQVLNQTKANMFLINIFEEIDEQEYSKSLKLVDNCKIEFEKSVISKIFENDERYNEFRFINSINQPISEEIKNIYSPNSIGFLATSENLADEEFVRYINELAIKFPEIVLNIFYLKQSHLKIIENIFNFQNLELIFLTQISQVFQKISVFLLTGNESEMKLRNKISFFISCIYLNFSIKYTIEQYEKLYKNYYELFFQNYELFDVSEYEIEQYEKSFFCIIFNKFIDNKQFQVKKNNLYSSLYTKRIELTLENKEFKEYFLQTNKTMNILYEKNKCVK